MKKHLIETLALPLITGCSTLQDVANATEVERDPGFRIYGGTRRNLKMIDDPGPHAGAVLVPLAILDFPWSLALDTGLLPFTLITEIVRGPAPTPKEH